MWSFSKIALVFVGLFELKIIFAIGKTLEPVIIGGHDTNITEVPWQLAHYKNGTQFCGGIIVGLREVISAGHCYASGDTNSSYHQYRAGSNNLLSGGTLHNVEYFIVHPEFDMTDQYITHDIAFARVKEPFKFSEFVQPIKIAEKDPENGEDALISGWGFSKFGNGTESPIILQSITLPVAGRQKCREWYSDFQWEIRDDMICVGIQEGGFGACNGDSGGPMVVNNEVVGALSWEDPCARPHHPSVYTSIPYYKEWIEQQIQGKS